MTAIFTGADAACEALEALGIRVIYGVPSQHNLALWGALARRGRIRVVGTRHEAGAVHAADGHARATGELGVALVSTGPGTANAMNGLYEAGFASSRVLLLTTQIDRVHLGRGRGFIHDADRQLEMLRTVTRRAERVEHASRIAPTILEVAAGILHGRPQPGAVEIPTDLLIAHTEPAVLRFTPPAPVPLDTAAASRAAERIAAARRPVLWIGGGAAGASKEMQALAEWLGAPVLSSANGRGTIPTDHPLFVGTHTYLPACRELLEGADLVLAIGTRFQAVATWYWSLPMPALVHVDVDAAAFHRNYRAEVAVQGDAALAARWLLQNGRAPAIDPGHLAAADRAREGIDAAQRARIGPDHAAICESMDRHLPTRRNLVCDATMAANTWGLFRLPVREPRSLAYSTSLAIGPALPLGIGAALGSGRKTVIVHGDGGVMLNLGELAVAAESGAPVIVLVFNDHGYGVLRQLQTAAGMPHAGVDLCTPDFAALGNAMGVPSVRAADAMAFDAAFADAAAAEGPRLIEIDMRGLAPLSL